MTDTTQNQLVTEIAYDLIAQTAPEELSLFTVTSTAYFKNPHQVRKELESKDEKLGFGAGVITALAPIIITIVDGVLKYVIEELLPQEIERIRHHWEHLPQKTESKQQSRAPDVLDT